MSDMLEPGRSHVVAARRNALWIERTMVRHHASAAEHHRWAARIHRVVSRLSNNRNDYAQASGQASIAHYHTSQALEYAKMARSHYALQGGDAELEDLEGLVLMALKMPVRVAWDRGGPTHHAVAAGHEDMAARYQDFAVRHCDENNHILAIRVLRLAYLHGLQSLFYAARLPNSSLKPAMSSTNARRLH